MNVKCFLLSRSCLELILNTGPDSIIQTLHNNCSVSVVGTCVSKRHIKNRTGPNYCLWKISFSSPAVLQLLLELLSGAVKREAAELIKHEGERALEDCAAPAATSGGCGHFTVNAVSVSERAVPISSVAHVVVSLQWALLSEEEEKKNVKIQIAQFSSSLPTTISM